MALITAWQPENRAFWDREGGRIARRNLAISIPALVLSFAVWSLFGVLVVYLPRAGFAFSTSQLFWLAALPALSGATLRIVYAFVVPVVGGARWTALSTASLLLPVIGLAIALQDPGTGFGTFAVLALACGLGGGNFASSMAHVSFCFPDAQKGLALGLNAGLGNLGVSLALFVVPLAVAGGNLGDVGLVWVPLIAAAALAAGLGMDDLAPARASVAEQARVFRRRRTAPLCWLYLGTFGSYIGYSAGLPLLLDSQFPSSGTALGYAWIGPFVGALTRPVGGWLADEWGAARVTFWTFVAMMLAAACALACLPGGLLDTGSLAGFLAASFALFLASGVGNGAVFRLVPASYASPAEGAAALGLASALGAYGGFVIPLACAASLATTASAMPALAAFVVFYATCAAVAGGTPESPNLSRSDP